MNIKHGVENKMIPEEVKERVVKGIEEMLNKRDIENELRQNEFDKHVKNIVTMENAPGANVTCGVCGTQFYLFTERQAEDYCMETGDSTVGGICPKCDCVYGRRYEF